MDSFFRLTGNITFETSAVQRIANLNEIESALDTLRDDEEFAASQILPFADLLGPGVVGIGIGHNNADRIFVYDWDYGLTYQAASLEEFCKQLKFEDASDLRKKMLRFDNEEKWKL